MDTGGWDQEEEGPSEREGKKLEQISPRNTVHGLHTRQRKSPSYELSTLEGPLARKV